MTSQTHPSPSVDSNAIQNLVPNKTWLAISSSNRHIVATDDKGVPYSWGDNTHGQLGTGAAIGAGAGSNTPTPIGIFSNVVAAAAGMYHTLILDNQHRLFAAGWSRFGALGNGGSDSAAPIDYATPISITDPDAASPWTGIYTKCFTSLGVKADNSLWAWGKNDLGSVGNGTTLNQYRPVRILQGAAPWQQISAGYDVSAAIDSNNDLYLWGNNQANQCSVVSGAPSLGTVNQPTIVNFNSFKWQQVAVGRTHILALEKTDGTLWACGEGPLGQLGAGPQLTTTMPQQMVQVTFPVSYSKILGIVASSGQSGALLQMADGTTRIYVWGQNSFGQTSGDGNRTGAGIFSPTRPANTESFGKWFAQQLGDQFAVALTG